jgi:hypothetical protein
MRVTVYKEGDRSLQRSFEAPATKFTLFVQLVGNAFDLESVEGLYEDGTGAPVHRIASLADGGLYFVRPSEGCALLRCLTTDTHEDYPAWPGIDSCLAERHKLRDMTRDYAAEPVSSEVRNSHENELLSRSARLAPVQAACDVQALLSTMVKGGCYSQGCTDCHDDCHVHTAALRALAAMLLRAPTKCTDVARTGGLALVLAVMSTFRDNVLLCKAGAWVISALFAGDKHGAARYIVTATDYYSVTLWNLNIATASVCNSV